ncbi:MAG TPA: DUF192 domain-containing protein [Candidatus Rifleibacterium sp.]|nr:DUF192 domain-containing protein [Candidatus Rifleibacterium sp.]HPT45628.1 DUF192 domain-containing protein [Candidatus Rifleibacterium sp.]
MKRSPVTILCLLLLTFLCLACQADSGPDVVTPAPVALPVEVQQGDFQILPETVATLAGARFNIMLARTFSEKAQGLMHYKSLADDRGMLFVYQSPRNMSFWMKNTMIPLDLVFISENLEVIEWIENMEPGFGQPEAVLPKYKSTQPAQYALELNAGQVKKLGLKVGDRLDIPITLLYSD